MTGVLVVGAGPVGLALAGDLARLETFDPTYGDNRYWLTSVGGHVLHQLDRPANGAAHSHTSTIQAA